MERFLSQPMFSGYQEFVLVAHSFGGLISLRYILDGLLGKSTSRLLVRKALLVGTPDRRLKPRQVGQGILLPSSRRCRGLQGARTASLRHPVRRRVGEERSEAEQDCLKGRAWLRVAQARLELATVVTSPQERLDYIKRAYEALNQAVILVEEPDLRQLRDGERQRRR